MANNQGWVKIHRQILEWEWYDEPNTFRLFFHLLIKANHKQKNYRGEIIKVGQIMTGLQLLSLETKLSIQKIRTSLNKLELTNEITIKSSTQGTIIQIVNYEKYQVVTNETTKEQQTDNKQVTTNKNVNNENNDNILDFEKFTTWFNYRRTQYLEIPSNIKRLTYSEKTTLGLLKLDYNKEDFELAMYNLCNDDWAIKNSQILCSYFLQTKIFNKFLSIEKKPMVTKKQRKVRGY